MSHVARVASTAANTLTEKFDIPDVFSTYLYTGTGAAQTITNGIDLDGEGGLVWTKSRDSGGNYLTDTVRGAGRLISTNSTDEESYTADTQKTVTSFNIDGYSLGTDTGNWGHNFSSAYDYVSWTFRKAPKFFDVVTYTGTGSTQNISHNLGTTVGALIVKKTDGGGLANWMVYHRGADSSSPEDYILYLNGTSDRNSGSGFWGGTAPTSTQFTVDTNDNVNADGDTYVAYLFAHNDGDGDFGPDGDQDIIKCGSYTGNGSTTGPEINLGFEPQWVMIKIATGTTDQWVIFDTMRGLVTGGDDNRLFPNLNNVEAVGDYIELTSTGFKPTLGADLVNRNTSEYIYMAIRRGPLAVPDDATKVFAIDTATSDNPAVDLDSGFPVDLLFTKRRDGGDSKVVPRLTMTRMDAGSTGSEGSASSFCEFDHMDKVVRLPFMGGASTVDYMWKRAPSYFDVVAYTGNATARTISHNLNAVPEMIWIKKRVNTDGGGGGQWCIYHSALGGGKIIQFNSFAPYSTSDYFPSTQSSSDTFSIGTQHQVNGNGSTMIAYLFATAAGVSKVGTYTGNGSNQDIDCGFSSGARFVLIRRSDSSGDWCVYDTVRGLVAGNDKRIEFNTEDTEDTDTDSIDPYSSGFNIVQESEANLNVSSATYIFYAIA